MTKIQYLNSLGIDISLYDLKNITRIGSKKTLNSWWVRIKQSDKTIAKTFADSKYHNNPIKSLEASIKFRDEQKKETTKSNSGYKNIFLQVQKNKNRAMVRTSHNGAEKSFSMTKHGYSYSLIQAILWINNRTNNRYLPYGTRLNFDIGLAFLKQNMNNEAYEDLDDKTQHYTKLYGEILRSDEIKPIVDLSKTFLFITTHDSILVKHKTLNNFIKMTFTFLKTKGYKTKIENIKFKHNPKEYFTVMKIDDVISSKEFCIDIIEQIKDDQVKDELMVFLSQQKDKISQQKKILSQEGKNIQASKLSKIINDINRLIVWIEGV